MGTKFFKTKFSSWKEIWFKKMFLFNQKCLKSSQNYNKKISTKFYVSSIEKVDIFGSFKWLLIEIILINLMIKHFGIYFLKSQIFSSINITYLVPKPPNLVLENHLSPYKPLNQGFSRSPLLWLWRKLKRLKFFKENLKN